METQLFLVVKSLLAFQLCSPSLSPGIYVWNSLKAYIVFKKFIYLCFIYLKGRAVLERNRQRGLPFADSFPKCPWPWGLGRATAGNKAHSPMWMNPTTWTILCCFWRCELAGSWMGSSGGPSDMGRRQGLQGWLNLLRHACLRPP